MMKVVGEEGTSIEDFVLYLKSEFLDSVYLQQDSFDPVDASVGIVRQQYVFDQLFKVLGAVLAFKDKEDARGFFNQIRQRYLDLNTKEFHSDPFKKAESDIDALVLAKKTGDDEQAIQIMKSRTAVKG
jgi:V/A-type H+-transporting ATPase subunit A